MVRTLFVLAVAFGTIGFHAVAEDKKDEKKAAKLSGVWVREAEGFEMKFAFKPETMTISAKSGDNGVTVAAKYTVEKDGTIKGTATEVTVKGEFPNPPKKGFEFSFQFAIDGKKAKLTDFKGEEAEGAKAVVEGEYESKPD